MRCESEKLKTLYFFHEPATPDGTFVPDDYVPSDAVCMAYAEGAVAWMQSNPITDDDMTDTKKAIHAGLTAALAALKQEATQ
jgi:hypothetical protein